MAMARSGLIVGLPFAAVREDFDFVHHVLDDAGRAVAPGPGKGRGQPVDVVHLARRRLPIGDAVGIDEDAVSPGELVLRDGDPP